MDEKHTFLSRGKKFNQKLKELLKKKLKDRYKINGYYFSNNKNDSSQKNRNKKSFLASYEEQQKTIHENEFRFAVEDYRKLKHNIYVFDWKINENKKKDNIIKSKNFPRDKINFSNLQEMLTEFLRNKNKHNDNMNMISKCRIKLDNFNRGIKENRINSILSKVSLHFNKAKTKVNLGKNGIDSSEHNYKELISILNEKRKKLQKYNNDSSAKKSKSLDIKSIDNIEKLKNRKYKINSNFNDNTSGNKNLDDIQNKINNIDNLVEKTRTINNYSEGRKYIQIYNNYKEKEKEKEKYKNNTICSNKIKIKIKNKNKSKYIIDTTNNSNSKYNNENEKNINNRFMKTPFSHSRNINSYFNQNFNSDSSNNNNNTILNTNKIINKTPVRSAFKRSSNKVKNLPLYTTTIEDILNEYDRIKKKSKLTKIHYRETHLMTYREIDKVVKIKEDLLVFLLQQKFLNNQFPLKSAKKPNKRKLFIKKLKDNVDSIDRRYLESFDNT